MAWTATAAMATIVVSLLAMVLVPQRLAHDAAPARRLQREVAEPARAEITALHLALASAETLLRDFIEPPVDTADAALLTGYGAAVERAIGHTDRLDTLSARWGDPAVERWVDSVRSAALRWRGTGAARISAARAATARARGRDSAHAEHYSATLLAVARLDGAVAGGVGALQARLDAADAAAHRWTVGLAVLALAGVGAAIKLGADVNRSARLAEGRRRELVAVLASKARFTRGVSHDLKNPLGAIDGHAALLEEEIQGPLTPDQRRSVGSIRRSVRSLLALVDDLLALARAETGELDVRVQSVELHALVRELADEHHAAFEAAGLALAVEIPDGACPLTTDPARVQQVLGNLLSNARKYTPRGGRVSVAVRNEGRHATVAVSDSGPGVPPEYRDRLFREFSRLPGTTAPGAGLGLAIARRIAHLLGGDLRIDETVAPAGARFVLELPLRGEPMRAPPPGAVSPHRDAIAHAGLDLGHGSDRPGPTRDLLRGRA